MVNEAKRRTGIILVPLSWQVLNRNEVRETDLLALLKKASIDDVLPTLVGLLQYGDSFTPPAFDYLDRRVRQLFGSVLAHRVSAKLEQSDHLIFFTRWQLLLAIKLVCTFGTRAAEPVGVGASRVLELLLMVNCFIDDRPKEPSRLDNHDDLVDAVKASILKSYSLIDNEPPLALVGRYSEMFKVLANSTNKRTFKSWVDIGEVLESRLGIQLPAFKAVLFSLYGNTLTQSGGAEQSGVPLVRRFDPGEWFCKTQMPVEALQDVLSLVTVSPDQIRENHLENNGETIGNAFDLSVLVRRPVIRLEGGDLAGLSGHLLIQRYTCGLYWDIHDSLSGGLYTEPSRQRFQTFFGELHERYGQNILRRITDRQTKAGKNATLAIEKNYLSEAGPNPDSVLVESIGSRNVRCVIFEFKVGRPKYKQSLVDGDVKAFQVDMEKKIESGLDQEMGFCRQLLSGQRGAAGIPADKVNKWFFVIVVTDPFPAFGVFLERLREKVADLQLELKPGFHGPFILSLNELEELETLGLNRVTELLIAWDSSTYRDWPFHSYYAVRTIGNPMINEHVSELGDQDLVEVELTLFGNPNPP